MVAGVVIATLLASASWGRSPQMEHELEPPEGRRAAVGRIVRVFDFEERADPSREDFNPEPVPRQWVRAQHNPPDRERPGFPLVNKARYDTSTAHTGSVSIVLPTSGGSAALRLSGTIVPVFPGVGYAVSSSVKTLGLRHARAFLSARLLNERGDPIPGAESRSEPVNATDWTTVRVELPGRSRAAAFIEIELLLLQPERFRDPPIAPDHHVWPEDLSGSAWFDDVEVEQLPRVALGVAERTSPTSVVPSGTPRTPQADADVLPRAGVSLGAAPRFSAVIQDLTGEEMSARLTLRDIDGHEVATLDEPLGPGGGRIDWDPPVATFGWFEATLEVLNAGRLIGSADARVVVLPPPPASNGNGSGPGAPGAIGDHALRDPRFGIVIDELRPSQSLVLPTAIAASGAGSATVPVPTRAPGHPASVAALRETLDPLLASGARLTLSMRAVDPDLASTLGIDEADPVAIFSADPAAWGPSLRGLLDAFGQRVSRWSIGRSVDPSVPPPGEVIGPMGAVHSGLSRYVPGPMVVLPWRAEWAWPALEPSTPPRPAVAMVAIEAPIGFSAPALAQLAGGPNGWKARRQGVGLNVVVELPEDEVGGRGPVIELIKRAALLWEALDPWNAGAETILSIRQPWNEGDPEVAPVSPEPAMAAWRTLVERLGPRRVAGRLPAPPGVTCLVLVDARAAAEGRRGGALLLWNDGSSSDEAELVQHLGSGELSSIDPFGNATPMRPLNVGGQYRLRAGTTPTFIEGVDAELALFIEGLRLDPPFIRAEAAEHEHRVVLTNPWPNRVAGEVQLAPPIGSVVRQSWRFTPTAPLAFALAPGERVSIPISFTFSPAEESGPIQIAAMVRMSSGANYPPLVLSIPATLGLPDVTLEPAVLLAPTGTGPDVILTGVVTCSGSRARSLQLEALAPGLPAQQQSVSALLPGETAVRRFVFRGAAAALSGKRLRLTLVDAEGNERLNRSVWVP